MSKAWGDIGAWAAEAELAEAEEKEKEQRAAAEAAATSHGGVPSLGESLTSKPRKKKQHQTFSLAEFTVGRPVTAGSKPRSRLSESRGLTAQEMMMLPRGGGGFPDDRVGADRPDRERDRNNNCQNWGSGKKEIYGRQAGYDPFYRQGSADGGRWERREPPPREEPQRRRLVLAPRTRPLSMSPPPASRGHTEVNLQPDGIPISLPRPPPRSRPNPVGFARDLCLINGVSRDVIVAGPYYAYDDCHDGVNCPLLCHIPGFI